jgi:hypothetical protein
LRIVNAKNIFMAWPYEVIFSDGSRWNSKKEIRGVD